MTRNWKTWLGLWLAIAVAGCGLSALLWFQGATTLARVLLGLTNALCVAWLFYGLWTWRHIQWVARIAWLVVVTVVTGLFMQLAIDMGWTSAAIAALGAYGMGVGFVLGLLLIRLLLTPSSPVCGVARTLIDEAIRMKVAVVFIVALVLMVPVLPLTMDAEELLKYRIQTFLAWSTMATALLLGLMTIFLSVGTITNEVHQRQIFLTMTKPIGRGRYLLGKWLGIVLLNLLLVSVCGAGIYVFTLVLAEQPARSPDDRRAVQEEVLVARRALNPQPAEDISLNDQAQQRLRQLQQSARGEWGAPGTPIEDLPTAKQQELYRTIDTQWMTIEPRETHQYVFTGLSEAKNRSVAVQLRLKPQTGGSSAAMGGFVYLDMRVNGRRPFWLLNDSPFVKLSEDTYHVLQMPAQAIDDNGNLTITLRNPPVGDREQGSINFNLQDGLQVMHIVGGFEMNLLRSLLLIWAHLCFLGMLGLAAGSFLGFPTASLLSLMVYFVGILGGYLQESLKWYASSPADQLTTWETIIWLPREVIVQLGDGEVWEAIKLVVKYIGEGVMLLLPSLSQYDPTPMLSEGLMVDTNTIGWGLFFMALWTLVVGLTGWVIFHFRELARVTV